MIAPVPLLTPADSARAVAAVYTVSLLAMLPIIVAVALGLTLRRARAEGRVLVWRAAIVLLISMLLARPFLSQSMSWVVPAVLATPLVALGRVQMMASTIALPSASHHLSSARAVGAVQVFFALYLAGAVLALLPTAIVIARMRGVLSRACFADARWQRELQHARARLGLRRHVRVFVSRDIAVPMTWGFARPVIAFPASAASWSGEEKRIALLHELTHVRRHDWLFAIAARVGCALYWFHPGVWYVARRLREDCEVACDDGVLASGVRPSAYAALLVRAADSLARLEEPDAALALCRGGGLRVRLASIIDVSRSTRPLNDWWRRTATSAMLAFTWPMSAVQLAPTRGVLTSLMQDSS